MSPPTATYTETATAPPDAPNGANGTVKLPLEPGLSQSKAKGEMIAFPTAPTFEDKHKERAYLKGKLAAAFRIFGKYGFDEGVAGHITLRVSDQGSAYPLHADAPESRPEPATSQTRRGLQTGC